jgi:hypothetical protein
MLQNECCKESVDVNFTCAWEGDDAEAILRQCFFNVLYGCPPSFVTFVKIINVTFHYSFFGGEGSEAGKIGFSRLALASSVKSKEGYRRST